MEAYSLSRISFRFFSRIFSPFPFSFLASNTLDFGGQTKAGTGENARERPKGIWFHSHLFLAGEVLPPAPTPPTPRRPQG